MASKTNKNNMLSSNKKVAGRIWVIGEEGTYLGEGRVALLKKIGEFGSISAAAKSMKMSYKKAWELIDSMNGEASEPLVIRETGGVNGGGTKLTQKGVAVIKDFESLRQEHQEFMEASLEKYRF